MTIRPPGRVTRTTSFATSNGLGANIAPKMLTTRSKLSSSSSFRSDASPSWNLQLVRPRLCARALPAATRLLAMSTPRTSAPSIASGTAVVPSPQPRSRTSSPSVIPNVPTNASPLSRMLSARRVKSPFSQSALFGFTVMPAPFIGRRYHREGSDHRRGRAAQATPSRLRRGCSTTPSARAPRGGRRTPA